MSKRDIKAELNNNSIIGGFIAPQESQKESHTEPKPIKETNSTTDKKELSEGVKKAIIKGVDIVVNGYKYKNGKDKTDNYTITFKIDADIEPFLKNIDKITFINSMETGAIETTTATDYVNELIRADLKKRFNIASDETDSNKWIDAYNKYAKKYGLKD